jgi:hypothetical protein
VGKEFRGSTNHVLAKELPQEQAVLSRGLEKLASKLELCGIVETLCDSIEEGRTAKKSIRFARLYSLLPFLNLETKAEQNYLRSRWRLNGEKCFSSSEFSALDNRGAHKCWDALLGLHPKIRRSHLASEVARPAG